MTHRFVARSTADPPAHTRYRRGVVAVVLGVLVASVPGSALADGASAPIVARAQVNADSGEVTAITADGQPGIRVSGLQTLGGATVDGVSAELYAVDEPLSRAELAGFLTRLLLNDRASNLAAVQGEPLPPDVDPANPYANDIRFVVAAGIAGGFADGSFLPEGQVTRAQAATFVARMIDAQPSQPPGSSFDDVADDDIHAANIEALVTVDILSAGGSFNQHSPFAFEAMLEWMMAWVSATQPNAVFEPMPSAAANAPVGAGTVELAITNPAESGRYALVVNGALRNQLIDLAMLPGPAPGDDPVDPEPGDPEPGDDVTPEPEPSDPQPTPTPIPIQSIEPACADAPTGPFTDVSGVHQPGIDCIAWWGVTAGVGGGLFAPDGPVTREQMASFIARTISLTGGELPADTGSPFVDIDGSTHAAAIEALAAAGVVSGTAPDRFDPGRVVTRAQMGTFLANTVEFRTGEALPIGAADFPDIDGNVHADNIRRIASAGLTGGTAAGEYDPNSAVTRAQMGTFLARLLALLVEQDAAPYPPSSS